MAIIWVIKGNPITNPDGTVTPGLDQNAYVDHLIQNNKYVNCLNYGSTLVWEELYGTYTRGTLPNGVSYLNCKRTSKDPSITAGYLNDGDMLYNDDVLTYEYEAEDYWTVTATTTAQTLKTSTTMTPDASVSPRTRETALEGVTATGITSSAHMYSIQFGNNFPDSSSTVTFYYYDNTGTKQTKVYNDGGGSSYITLLPCWCGGEVSWTPSTTASYWTAHLGYYLAGTQSKGTIVQPSSFFTRDMRTIYIVKNTGVASLSVTYTNSAGKTVTTSYTASDNFEAWQGATITWTATASSGYTMSTSSGTIAIGTSGATISPTAKASYSKGWYSYPEFTSTLSNSWTSSQWSSTTYSNTVSLKTFAYLRVHTSGVRVSGTMTMGTKTVSFSNVSLTLNSYTNVAMLEYSSRYTYALQLQLSGNTLGARAQCTSTAKYKRAFSITITSIQVYTYPAEAKLSAPANVSIGDYTISVTNGNEVSTYCVYQGYALFGSSYEYRDTGAWGMGSTPLIVTSGNSNQIGSVALLGSDEDVSINTLEAFKIAFVADAYLDVGEYVSLDF